MALLVQKLLVGKKLSKTVFGYFKTKKRRLPLSPAIKKRTFSLAASLNKLPKPHETQEKFIKLLLLCSVLVNINQQKKVKNKYLKIPLFPGILITKVFQYVSKYLDLVVNLINIEKKTKFC